nr:THO complex subunit 4A [Ipomoea batatas]
MLCVYNQSFEEQVDIEEEHSTMLCVYNLGDQVTSDDIRRFFAHIGPVATCTLKCNRLGQSTGIAELVYSYPGDAIRAIRMTVTVIHQLLNRATSSSGDMNVATHILAFFSLTTARCSMLLYIPLLAPGLEEQFYLEPSSFVLDLEATDLVILQKNIFRMMISYKFLNTCNSHGAPHPNPSAFCILHSAVLCFHIRKEQGKDMPNLLNLCMEGSLKNDATAASIFCSAMIYHLQGTSLALFLTIACTLGTANDFPSQLLVFPPPSCS